MMISQYSVLCERYALTYRQAKVLKFLIDGYSVSQICEKMNITKKACYCVVEHIKKKITSV